MKSKRPLAARQVSVKQGLLIALLFVLKSLFIAYSLDVRIFLVAMIYLFLNILYSGFLIASQNCVLDTTKLQELGWRSTTKDEEILIKSLEPLI